MRFNHLAHLPDSEFGNHSPFLQPMRSSLLYLMLFVWVTLSGLGCDTGFGEPCTLPKGDVIQQACSAPAVAEGDESGTTQASSATCALDNFPGCDTFLCLKYRGANPYCSQRCQDDTACSGGHCCPLSGDCKAISSNPAMNMSIDPATTNPCANGTECYCILSADYNR